MTTDKRTKKARKGCYEVALRRARLARRVGSGASVVWLLFVWALLSAPFARKVLPLHMPARMGGQTSQEDWPVTDYERGLSGPFKRGSFPDDSRYRVRPSLKRLMGDLRRPAARADAAAALALRIPFPEVQTWAAKRIDKGEINRLAIWVRPGRPEDAVISAWQEEANAERHEDAVAARGGDVPAERADMLRVARLLDELAGTETVTSEGPERPRKS